MAQDLLVTRLRQAWRATVLRHAADVEAGRETDGVRALADRFLALLNEKPADSSDAVADMRLRATLAAAIAAEVEDMEKHGR